MDLDITDIITQQHLMNFTVHSISVSQSMKQLFICSVKHAGL